MTDNTKPSFNRPPSYFAYVIRKGSKNFWDRVGVAWTHSDGKGINVALTSLPVEGYFTLRLASKEK